MKRVFEWHGRKYYLLGTGADGQNYWMEEARFECFWYWGIGYVETFTNNKQPWRSADISCHTHFDGLMERQRNDYGETMNWWDAFHRVFRTTPLTDKEIWKVMEIMKSLYTARKYSNMLHLGGSNYTDNPAAEIIKNPKEYHRINQSVIPALLTKLYNILDGTARKEEEEATRNGKRT